MSPHFGLEIYSPQSEVTTSNEVRQSHKWLSGFLGGLVPFAAAEKHQEVAVSGTWHVQGGPGLREVLHEHVLVRQEEPTKMIIQSHVILEVYRARDMEKLI